MSVFLTAAQWAEKYGISPVHARQKLLAAAKSKKAERKRDRIGGARNPQWAYSVKDEDAVFNLDNGLATKPIEKLEREHHLQREIEKLKDQLRRALDTRIKSGTVNNFIEGCLHAPTPDPPNWVLQPKNSKLKHAIPTAFLSDTHFGEVVRPEEIEYLNGYDREIGALRLKNFFRNSITLSKDFLRGFNYQGIVLPLGGDMFSGDIHEELQKTNAGTMQEEILHWIDPMIAGIRMLADEFGKVWIPCVVGNHPRGTKKPTAKMRVPNNFDWLFYCLLQRFLANDKRVEFNIAKSADCRFPIYSTRYLLSHGDQFRGGSGISAALSPLMIGESRKRKRSQASDMAYDWLLLGHWHQYWQFKNIMVNGALKGYDEYAYTGNFDFELPTQSFWITDPKHGVTIKAPIHVLDKSESWLKFNRKLSEAA